jgi:hypothetical protein
MAEPLPAAHPALVRISCPECDGVLDARGDGPKHHLMFVCRVQHTFSVVDVLNGKEDQLEARLWSAVNLAEEMAELVIDLAGLAERQSLPAAVTALRERAARATALAAALRGAIDTNHAIDAGDEVTRIHADGGPRRAAP